MSVTVWFVCEAESCAGDAASVPDPSAALTFVVVDGPLVSVLPAVDCSLDDARAHFESLGVSWEEREGSLWVDDPDGPPPGDPLVLGRLLP